MIDDNNIAISPLCVLQFREPVEHAMYPEQVEMYAPKVCDQILSVQILVNAAIKVADNIWLRIYTDKGYKIAEKKFSISVLLVDTYFYANAIFTANEIAAISENSIVYFSIETNDTTPVVYGESIWYCINPLYRGDLKQITYTHSVNDWNMVFGATVFTITVESGFVPTDSRDEQETEDFLEQNMINDTVFGDSYEVLGFTIGSSDGIPNWLRKKISMATLCDIFKINSIVYKRIQSAKMEKTGDTFNGLSTYKIDLQTDKNYLQ